MKKILTFVLTLCALQIATAQIENYDKEDILECLELILEHPTVQDAMQRDGDYQNEFSFSLRDPYVRFNPVRKILQDIDQMDIGNLDYRLFLDRSALNPNRREWDEDGQRRRMSINVQYDEVTDAFEMRFNTERIVEPNNIITYFGSFVLEKYDDVWEITSDNISKDQRRR